MDHSFHKDLDLNIDSFTRLKDMLAMLYPEASDLHRDFLIRLTPEQLKWAYIRQATSCHPRTVRGLTADDRELRQAQYERLAAAYKILLPQIEDIHQKVMHIRLLHKKSNSSHAPARTILAVGGAKGGVGKSIVAVNLAVGLALIGKRVVLADLDLGGADAHLLLGVKTLSADWNDFLDHRSQTLDDILTPTPFERLSLIGGNSSRLGIANLNHLQKLKIIRHLKAVQCDYLILDLGGNSSLNALDFFLAADHKVVVTAPEPTSFLDTYNFVKVSFYRLLDRLFAEHRSLIGLRRHIRELSFTKPDRPTFKSIMQEVRTRDPSAYFKLKVQLGEYRISILVNMAENGKDARVGESMKRLVERLFSVDVGILGTIPLDAAVRKAARQFTPFLVDDPRCRASQAIEEMLAKITLAPEPESIRVDLARKTRHIRGKVEHHISNAAMQVDGMTEDQIGFISSRSPTVRRGLHRLLGIVGKRPEGQR